MATRQNPNYTILPGENAAAYDALLNALVAEHQPTSPTESFLIQEMAYARWKIDRLQHADSELLNGPDAMGHVSRRISALCAPEQRLVQINRLEECARRTWYKALAQLHKLRAQKQTIAQTNRGYGSARGRRQTLASDKVVSNWIGRL